MISGTHIMSDQWKPYVHGIPRMINAATGLPLYTHTTVNHSQNFVNPTDGTNTQLVENMWNVAKSRNRARHGTHRSTLDSYLCEFMWRRRYLGADYFLTILQQIALYNPPS
jgi:hypothetical protein